ncbi:MAG: sigma-54-dependent Fis family transcriptional regulator, partial [Calditrichaeota bacterium]|nr:sigma-54-dependent Fis family transcriptional regulator [Calditrichota bacterium]
GNVRELENLLMSGVMRSTSDTLQLEIPDNSIQAIRTMPAQSETETVSNSWDATLADVEKEHISSVLIAVKGHLGRACEVLCITRPTLRKKMNDYGLKDSFN